MADYHPPAPKLQEQDLKGKDKVAIVTGATKGIGRSIALSLATRGCSILGTYSSPESAHLFDTLTHTVQGLHSTPLDAPKMRGVVADITTLPSISAILTSLTDHFHSQKLSIVVFNASFNTRPRVGAASEHDISSSLTGNLHWPIVVMENLVRQNMFTENSRVVVISSDRVRDPSPGSGLFNATRAAMESLVRSWATELPYDFPGTTVNAVSVGLTDTPGLRSFPPAAVEALKEQRLKKVKVVEGGRMGYAEDVADVVDWLVSEKSRWVTGSVMAANGGAEWVGGSS
ncbi:FabG Dehydrogenase with different specificities (related to short-chain alcohol dehydrogenase) [Pyrenophora tritici-repentis]|uniref:Dehydrogenase n=1 Tax=Pyrenophora tritici-repentis TaxID=45151 RepID=A0A2W1E4T0_9PLEO|nr:FabG, Dehydrogenase with different specificities (related to short-chain alcohol dehydrogenase) [Pyrenophora tritici-repentis]KAI0585597.1 FabG Dehydrogenase with different specificities (related to short-chain alcohol dehydrogenase) [Pyrenophora tritici-repentis]KAI0590143.1 FabG Dehydrogenase with different specificities (related to short-chain alcohol dehydrogenase) [Pyrenophora tritici-repentis]KAI0613905.1 FabG Dehydrogenase with different specificities (related to short-chain alcohol de